jgi:hypothetical protein
MKPTKLQIDIVRTVHHAKQRFRVDIKKEQVPEFLEMFLPYKRNGKHFNKRVKAAIYNLLSRKYLRKGYKESLIVTLKGHSCFGTTLIKDDIKLCQEEARL